MLPAHQYHAVGCREIDHRSGVGRADVHVGIANKHQRIYHAALQVILPCRQGWHSALLPFWHSSLGGIYHAYAFCLGMFRTGNDGKTHIRLASFSQPLYPLLAGIQHGDKQIGHLWFLQRSNGHQACRVVLGCRHNAYLVFVHRSFFYVLCRLCALSIRLHQSALLSYLHFAAFCPAFSPAVAESAFSSSTPVSMKEYCSSGSCSV